MEAIWRQLLCTFLNRRARAPFATHPQGSISARSRCHVVAHATHEQGWLRFLCFLAFEVCDRSCCHFSPRYFLMPSSSADGFCLVAISPCMRLSWIGCRSAGRTSSNLFTSPR